MTPALDLGTAPAAARRTWTTPKRYWAELTAATRHLDAPVGVLHLDALRHNLHDMRRRAGGTPIRLATKSLRVRGVIDAVLAVDGFAGALAYTLDEALWLSTDTPVRAGITDVVVGYPSTARAAIHRLASSAELAARVTLMVDSVAQLDIVDQVAPPHARPPIRVALELDASWRAPLGHIGVWRSPVFSVADARQLAEVIARRPGFQLVGMMSYEAQIAGQGDRPENAAWGATVRWMQTRSRAELAERRAAAVAALRDVAELEFVNGGGTGSLEYTHSDASVTEIGAGSGVFGGHLFDHYRSFRPAPAAAFALDVVRKPTPETVTLLGGGWIASGPPGVDRLPLVAWPRGLHMVSREMAGEVQTPLTGAVAGMLAVGDRVWLRHTKSGELGEHLNAFQVVHDGRVVDELPTYRGEGMAFL